MHSPQTRRSMAGRPLRVINDSDRPIRQSIVRYKQRRLDRAAGSSLGVLRALLRENIIPQPAVFWRRTFGETIGKLDESLHWTMDYDLWLRMVQVSPPMVLNRLVARFRHHPTSKSGAFSGGSLTKDMRWRNGTHKMIGGA